MTTRIVRSRPSRMVGELPPGGRVEVRGRLVEHEQLRLHREHRRDRDPPALPEAEVVRRAVDVRRPCRRRRAPRRPGRRARRPRRPRLAGPKATSSRTVGMNSWSSGSWKTMATRRRISARLAFVTGSPPTVTVPACGSRMPLRCRTRVVLPAPFGPEHGDPLAGGRRAGRRRRAPRGRRGRRSADPRCRARRSCDQVGHERRWSRASSGTSAASDAVARRRAACSWRSGMAPV